jgi:hypothetical protein
MACHGGRPARRPGPNQFIDMVDAVNAIDAVTKNDVPA